MRAVKLGGFAAAGALGLAALVGTPSAAAPKPTPKTKASSPPASPTPALTCVPAKPVASLTTEPWAQQRLDFTRVWNLTRGKGVTVAIVDSGVDANNVQLTGHVSSIDLTHTVRTDCVGHGTAVAGIIGAQDRRPRHQPIVGVAPDARPLSVKFTNQERTLGAVPDLPLAIRTAADHKAKVINVSLTSPDTAALRAAVQYAQAHDALVVAAAGNVTDQDRGTTGPAYPAAYPDVVAVGSLSPDGSLADSSNTTTKVSVSAPGKQVATIWPGGYAPAEEGTSFAAAFVSGTAALVRAYHPALDYEQVKRRLEATADGSSETGSGAGMINPVEAVTALLPGEGTNSAPAVPGAGRAIRVVYRHQPDRRTRSIALLVTGIALGGTAVAVAAGVLIPTGRRRRWQPGTRTPSERQDS